MINRLQQVFDKFYFCLRSSGGIRSLFLLIINSKRFSGFQKLHTASLLKKHSAPVRYCLQLDGRKRTVYLRTYAGDIRMFYEIFLDQVYRLPASFLVTNGVIIDAGSNIGMAGLYFSLRFPRAQIYCIEPAKENFRLLQMNLRPELYSGKLQAAQVALYIKDGTTGMNDKGWSYNAAVDDGMDHTVTTVTINTFLSSNQLSKIDLLKMDIEGSEAFVFLADTGWLQHVKAILIEIHSAELIAQIKSVLVQAGFYWYSWNFTSASSNIFLASKTMIAAERLLALAKI